MKYLLLFINLFTAPAILNAQLGILRHTDGDGNIVKEERTRGSFNAIAVSGSANVILKNGSSEKITVEADQNLMGNIVTDVKNNKLSISVKNASGHIIIYAEAEKINAISLNGSGSIEGQGAFQSEGKVDIKLSGSGKIQLGFENVEDLNIFQSGSGNITLTGKASNVSSNLSGSGTTDALGLQCNDLDAVISGSGSIKVTASSKISARISGSGKVYYRGEATDIDEKTLGSGKVIKIED